MFTDSDKVKLVDCEWSKEKQRADRLCLDSLLFSVKIRFFSTLSEVLNKIIPIVKRKHEGSIKGFMVDSYGVP